MHFVRFLRKFNYLLKTIFYKKYISFFGSSGAEAYLAGNPKDRSYRVEAPNGTREYKCADKHAHQRNLASILCITLSLIQIKIKKCFMIFFYISTGGKPRNYHEIVLTQICSQATSGTRRGSFQAENWIKKGWCHVHFCFILQLRTNNGKIRQCSSV